MSNRDPLGRAEAAPSPSRFDLEEEEMDLRADGGDHVQLGPDGVEEEEYDSEASPGARYRAAFLSIGASDDEGEGDGGDDGGESFPWLEYPEEPDPAAQARARKRAREYGPVIPMDGREQDAGDPQALAADFRDEMQISCRSPLDGDTGDVVLHTAGGFEIVGFRGVGSPARVPVEYLHNGQRWAGTAESVRPFWECQYKLVFTMPMNVGDVSLSRSTAELLLFFTYANYRVDKSSHVAATGTVTRHPRRMANLSLTVVEVTKRLPPDHIRLELRVTTSPELLYRIGWKCTADPLGPGNIGAFDKSGEIVIGYDEQEPVLIAIDRATMAHLTISRTL